MHTYMCIHIYRERNVCVIDNPFGDHRRPLQFGLSVCDKTIMGIGWAIERHLGDHFGNHFGAILKVSAVNSVEFGGHLGHLQGCLQALQSTLWRATLGSPCGHFGALGSHLGHLGCHLRIIMQCRSQNVDFPNGFWRFLAAGVVAQRSSLVVAEALLEVSRRRILVDVDEKSNGALADHFGHFGCHLKFFDVQRAFRALTSHKNRRASSGARVANGGKWWQVLASAGRSGGMGGAAMTSSEVDRI